MNKHGLAMQTKTKLAHNMPEEYENKIIEFHQYIINAGKKLPILNLDKLQTYMSLLI